LSPDKKELPPGNRDFKIDLKELNKIVFESSNLEDEDTAYGVGKNLRNKTNHSYQEEESYENP
jgi:hypothetical protein